MSPTKMPTKHPTHTPSKAPSHEPSAPFPTLQPSPRPTHLLTPQPTAKRRASDFCAEVRLRTWSKIQQLYVSCLFVCSSFVSPSARLSLATTTRGIAPLTAKLAVLSRVAAAATIAMAAASVVVVPQRADQDLEVLRCAAPA